jgi:hypothetical protein
VEILSGTSDTELLISGIEEIEGVHYLKIIGRE